MISGIRVCGDSRSLMGTRRCTVVGRGSCTVIPGFQLLTATLETGTECVGWLCVWFLQKEADICHSAPLGPRGNTAADVFPGRFGNTVSKRVSLEDWSRLKTGVARVLGERCGREERGAGGSLRVWSQPEAARRILENTGIGSVLGKGCGAHCGARPAAMLLEDTDRTTKIRQVLRFKGIRRHVMMCLGVNVKFLLRNGQPSLEELVQRCQLAKSRECKGHIRGAGCNVACFHLEKILV